MPIVPQPGTSKTMAKTRGIGGDLFGGVTAGIVALPLALAFGVQSGMGAIAGLYGAIFLGFFAAIFGGTPTQISGPTGPMTVVSAATVASIVGLTGGLEAAIPALVATFVLTGLFQVAMGVTGIGSLIKFIPYPVISGFMSGIGVIIILLQLYPALGLASPANTLDVVRSLAGDIGNFQQHAVELALLTIVTIYLFPRLTRSVPSALVALIVVTGLSVFLGRDVPVIGTIPSGIPVPHFDHLTMIPAALLGTILASAATLAALGAIDSLLTSVVADNVTRTQHDSNRELIGQGIGNSVAGLFGGLPGAGATMRTLVNIRSGGHSRLSGVVHATVLAVVLLGAGPLAAYIPKSVLAGILITVGIGILDYKGIRHLTKVPRSDAAVMLIVLLVTVFLDLLVAVGVGMTLATVLFMKKMSDVTAERSETSRLSAASDDAHWPDEMMPRALAERVLIKRLDGPLFFGFASAFQRQVVDPGEIRVVIIRMDRVPFIDQTGLYALDESILAFERQGIEVLLTGLQPQPGTMLRRLRLIPDLIEDHHVFDSFQECVDWLSSEAGTGTLAGPEPVPRG